jgi:hypothetical protein
MPKSRTDDAQTTDWETERQTREARMKAASRFADDKIVTEAQTTALLEAIIRPGDRVCVEGDNQKQADFLALLWQNLAIDWRNRIPESGFQ